MNVKIDAANRIVPLRVNQIPFLKSLTNDGQNFAWIAGFQECEKLQTETIPHLGRKLRDTMTTPLDGASLEAWIDAGYDEYLEARITAITQNFTMRGNSFSIAPGGIADYLVGDKIPPFVTKDELIEAVKRFSAGKNGISEQTRAAETRRIRESLRSAEAALSKKSDGFMVRPIGPYEQDINVSGGLVDMRRVFVESWRNIQKHTTNAVGPQGFPLHLSGSHVQAAHAELCLDKLDRRRHVREALPAAVPEFRRPKII